MGEACADALDKYPGHTVLHVNGGFHSAYWDGTVHQLKLRKPDANILTVAIVPTSNPAVEEVQGEPEADFIAFVEARATDLNEGMYSVYGQQQIKYRLHMPQQATPDQPVPLLIFLTDDGFTASDGLDLWKERLGNEVAIAVVEAPYRETQEDFGIGGRWFWPDSFASDVGGLVGVGGVDLGLRGAAFSRGSCARVRGGRRDGRHGRGQRGVAGRSDGLKAVAVAPRQYAKMKDFPLPLPEAAGSTRRHRRSRCR